MRVDSLNYSILTVASSAGANAAADATIAAPGEKFRIVVFGISVSASNAPANLVEATLIEDTAGTPITRDAFFLPNALFNPVVASYRPPIVCAPNVNVRLRIPALGSGVTGRAVIRYAITTE